MGYPTKQRYAILLQVMDSLIFGQQKFLFVWPNVKCFTVVLYSLYINLVLFYIDTNKISYIGNISSHHHAGKNVMSLHA
jgi:hypothetical protein